MQSGCLFVDVTGTDNLSEIMETSGFKQFNEDCKRYVERCEQECRSYLENEIQHKVFSDWLSGKSIYGPKYRSENNVSEYDFENANSSILQMCSMGCG